MVPTITAQQRTQFETEGFTILEDVFTQAEMADLANHIEIHQRRNEERIASKGGTEGISRAGEITFTSHLAENDENILAFVKREEFVRISTEFLGPDVDLYWNQSVFKGKDTTTEFPWHQDDGYTPVTPSPYLTLWLALNDATQENGCISVVPGSHKQGLAPHVPSPIGLQCHSLTDLDQGIRVPVKGGSIVAFQSLLFHKSGTNTSTGVRKAYVIQYAHAGLRSIKNGEVVTGDVPIARGGVAAGTS